MELFFDTLILLKGCISVVDRKFGSPTVVKLSARSLSSWAQVAGASNSSDLSFLCVGTFCILSLFQLMQHCRMILYESKFILEMDTYKCSSCRIFFIIWDELVKLCVSCLATYQSIEIVMVP